MLGGEQALSAAHICSQLMRLNDWLDRSEAFMALNNAELRCLCGV